MKSPNALRREGQAALKFGGNAIYAPQRRQQQGVRRPHLPGQIHLQHLHSERQHSARARPTSTTSPTWPTTSRATETPNYTVDDTLVVAVRAGRLPCRTELTVNLGLRYEQQTFTDSRGDVAPRVGFVYDVKGAGKTVIRGGFGIYYSQIVDNSEANYALTGPTGVFNYTATPGRSAFPPRRSARPFQPFPPGARCLCAASTSGPGKAPISTSSSRHQR